MVTAVLLYINAEGGMLTAEKQNVDKQNHLRGASCSILKLTVLPDLWVRPHCVRQPQCCVEGTQEQEAVTSQCCPEWWFSMLLAGFGLQSSRETRSEPQVVSVSMEAATRFMVRSLKLFLFWQSPAWTAVLFSISLGISSGWQSLKHYLQAKLLIHWTVSKEEAVAMWNIKIQGHLFSAAGSAGRKEEQEYITAKGHPEEAGPVVCLTAAGTPATVPCKHL